MSMKRNEILEVGHHTVMHYNYEFDGGAMAIMGIIVGKEISISRDHDQYHIYLEDGNDASLYTWGISKVVPFSSDGLNENCIFSFSPNTEERRLSKKYRPLSKEELVALQNARLRHNENQPTVDDDDIPF